MILTPNLRTHEKLLEIRFEAWKTVKKRWGLESHITSHEPSLEDVLTKKWDELSEVAQRFDREVEEEFQVISKDYRKWELTHNK